MKRIVFVALLLGMASTAAHAETTEWMRGFKAYYAWAKQERRNITLVAVECRDTGKRGLNVADFEYRITFEARDPQTPYYWAVGSNFGKVDREARQKGYELVSYSAFRRKNSGLLVRCGVWHRK